VTDPSTTEPDGPTIRTAVPADAPAVADVYLAAFTSTYDFPLVHTDEQIRDWLVEYLLPPREAWVAEDDGRVVAMMVLDDEGIDQLYVEPAWHGRGIGGRLVEVAKLRRPGGIRLYTFQVNERARRFYEHRGFVVARLGDGSDNEERQPDVRYEWRP
jgi:GNAT superfamily N-acetyltransferase